MRPTFVRRIRASVEYGAPRERRGSWPAAIALAAAAAMGCGGHSGTGGAATGPKDASGASSDFDAGFTAPPPDDGQVYPMGDAGCSLDAAAFCETFDTPSTTTGRAGELDPSKWSGARLFPQLPTENGQPFPILAATIPSGCRSGLPATAFPDDDTLICNANANIQSNHLLVDVAVQNYGQNSYRIRQPFDFAGRTGKIVFDAEAFNLPLLGWISLDVTEDPTAVPSFGILVNEEGAVIPQNAFEIQFSNPCGAGSTSTATTGTFALDSIHVFANYVDTVSSPGQSATCLPSQQGNLNHFEIDVSQQHIDVYATPFSSDGVSYGTPQLLYGADVNIPFARGYVHIATHNHATVKYSANNALISWPARWDNVGFDGPVIDNWREYDVPDSLVAYAGLQFGFDNYTNLPMSTMNVGYIVADESAGPNAPLHFSGVDLTNVASARISLSSWYDIIGATNLSQFALNYRLNGNTWHNRPFTAGELGIISPGPTIIENGAMSTGGIQGAFDQMLDVDPSELVAGDNTLELTTSNIPLGTPPGVANVDLVLTTQ